jgi:LysM repeat protein
MAIEMSTYKHKMLPGQTLSQIAALYAVPLAQIALPLGLNRAALMKARGEQLFADESLFIARMQG